MRRRLIASLIIILVVAFGGLAANLIASNHPALGLDLQGGISVTQKPIGPFTSEGLDLTVERIRDRIDSLGVSEPEIVRQGDAIVVNLPGVKDQEKAISLVQVTGQVYLRPVLACVDQPVTTDTTPTETTAPGSATTTPGGSTPTATSAPAAVTGSTPAATAATASTAASAGFKRPESVPTTPATPTTAPATSAAPTTTPSPTTAAGGPTSTVDPNLPATTTPAVVSDPTQTQILPQRTGGYCQVGPSQGTGEVFDSDATARIVDGGWGVTVGLRDGAKGEDVWNNIATQCFNGASTCPSHRLAIELDGTIISAPTVQTPTFNGQVQITGAFSQSEAANLARVLKSGSLPVRLETEAVQNVSPTLGKDSLRAAIIAGLVGVGLVMIYMLLYYRFLAWVAVAGLLVSAALLWSVIALLSRTSGLALSLSGIAGIIVSIGVTIDSYVVFFERLKDEVRAGRSMRNSAQRGFAASWHTILVADLVSLIGAFVLWYLTVGSVRNFAFFLGLSTLIDLVVHYYFTRPAVLLLSRTEWMAHRKVMGIEAVGANIQGPAGTAGATT